VGVTLTRSSFTRLRALSVAVALGLAVAVWPELAATQDERDFIFTDEDGHLVLRFVGTASGSLDTNQREEIVNVQLSTMVHDRLRADAVFEAEAIDPLWAAPMESRIERHLNETLPEFSGIHAECRSTSCRLVLEHKGGRSVSAHESLMDAAQDAIGSLIEADPAGVEPVFLMAAHYQDPEQPYIKVFLRRAPGMHRPFRPVGN
jgi:hypothetical protein